LDNKISRVFTGEETTFSWPDGYKSAAVLSFDVDASVGEHIWSHNVLGVNSVGDYGPKVGVPRILKLLDKYDIKAAFFFPGWVAERFPKVVKAIYDKGHDIGGHGYLHEKDLSKLTEEDQIATFTKTWKILSDITGASIHGFRPSGEGLTPQAIKILCDLGWRYAFNTTASYHPCKVMLNGKELDLIKLPLSFILDDHRFFWGGSQIREHGITQYVALSSCSDALDYWMAEFESTYGRGELFSLTCHPRAIGRPSRMRVLEKVLRHIKHTPGVWFPSVSALADWVLRK
jgi:peptidoglycan/xylan/chitin deacetylase (PgdA/CDA1 family)